MATIHISQAEAERDLSSLIARIDENTTFVIENGAEPVAVLQAAPPRKLSFEERLALLPKDSEGVIDDQWPADLDEAIERHRAPVDRTKLAIQDSMSNSSKSIRCQNGSAFWCGSLR